MSLPKVKPGFFSVSLPVLFFRMFQNCGFFSQSEHYLAFNDFSMLNILRPAGRLNRALDTSTGKHNQLASGDRPGPTKRLHACTCICDKSITVNLYLNLAPIDKEIKGNHLGFLLLLGLRNHKPIMRRYPDGKTTEKEYQEKAQW